MTSKPLRLAVIGAGVMGCSHIERIRASTECVLGAVCDPNLTVARRASDGKCSIYTNLPELLKGEQCDGAIIATPNAEHRTCGLLCAESGIPMLVEKPIAATTTDGNALVKTASRKGIPLLVGQHRRHSSYVQRTREALEHNQIGRLVSFTALWFVRKPEEYYDVDWRTRPSGGPVLTNLIHEIDLIRYLGGEITSVYADCSTAARGLLVEDSVAITLRLESGALGSITASDATVSPWSYEMTTHENRLYTQSNENCYFLLGTTGSLSFPRLTLWRHSGETGWQHPLRGTPLPVDAVDPIAAQLAHFCEVIRGRADPFVSGQDALATLAATEAVLQSARKGLPIRPQTTVP